MTFYLAFCMGVRLGLCSLGEEHRFSVSENRLLRRRFEYKWEEVVRGWRKLHSDALIIYTLHRCYYSVQLKESELGG
jgi:hypothetical protein